MSKVFIRRGYAGHSSRESIDWPTILIVGALLLYMVTSSVAQVASTDNPSIAFVRIRVNIDYDDSDESLNQLKEIAAFLKPAKAIIQPGETLSTLIVRLYGFGPTDGIPKTYQLLESEILRLNKWDRPEVAMPGECLVPRVPKRRGQNLYSSNPYYAVPAIRKTYGGMAGLYERPQWSVDSIESNEILKSEAGWKLTNASNQQGAEKAYLAIEQMGVRSAEFRKSTSFYDMQIVITESDLRSNAGQKFLKSPHINAAVIGADMPIQFAASQENSDTYRLSEKDTKLIGALLGNEPRRKVHVFILDSGWPNSDAYDSSRRAIFTMFDTLRQLWKLSPKARTGSTTPFVEPTNIHCKEISSALNPFQNLDVATKRISVIYFPVTLEQDAKGILEELFELAYVADKMGLSLGENPPPSDVQRDALGYARNIVKTLPKDACAPKVNGECSKQVHTNKAILEGLWVLADGITKSGAARPVYFINESWTVGNDTLAFRAPGKPNGIAVVAAGNNGTVVNSDSDGVDFARQCFPARNVLTVMYATSGKGLQCRSSKVMEEKSVLDNTMATAFNGSIPEGCGTSFAAPRVAWLLALAEAYRSYDVDRTRWATDVQKRLVETRNPTSGIESLIFDLEEYIRRSVSSSSTH